MRDEIVLRVARAICKATERELGVEQPEALAGLTFDQLGLDSIAVLSGLVAVEDEFNIEFGDETPQEALRSLGSLADYLQHAYLGAA